VKKPGNPAQRKIRCFGWAERPDTIEHNNQHGYVEWIIYGPGCLYWWLDEEFQPHTRFVEDALEACRIDLHGRKRKSKVEPGHPLQFKIVAMPKNMALAIHDIGRYEIFTGRDALARAQESQFR
jgi:hypothetical protein